MLKCDGYKMFYGRATVSPVNGKPPYQVTGTWLYKPEYDCWYVETGIKGDWCHSIPASIVSDFEELEGC